GLGHEPRAQRRTGLGRSAVRTRGRRDQLPGLLFVRRTAAAAGSTGRWWTRAAGTAVEPRVEPLSRAARVRSRRAGDLQREPAHGLGTAAHGVASRAHA